MPKIVVIMHLFKKIGSCEKCAKWSVRVKKTFWKKIPGYQMYMSVPSVNIQELHMTNSNSNDKKFLKLVVSIFWVFWVTL